MYAWHTGRDLKAQYDERMEAMRRAGIHHDSLVMRPLWGYDDAEPASRGMRGDDDGPP
jgi:hypothetical protein